MLTLTRRAGESVVIGDSIRVTVKEVRGRTVQLAIEAPRGIPVYREEIYRTIEAENRAAAAQGGELPDVGEGAAIRLGPPTAGSGRKEDEP